MVLTVKSLMLWLALICFIVAAVVSAVAVAVPRLNLPAMGLAFLTTYMLIP